MLYMIWLYGLLIIMAFLSFFFLLIILPPSPTPTPHKTFSFFLVLGTFSDTTGMAVHLWEGSLMESLIIVHNISNAVFRDKPGSLLAPRKLY